METDIGDCRLSVDTFVNPYRESPLLVLFIFILAVASFLVLILSLGSSLTPSPLNEDFDVRFLNLTDLGVNDVS